MFLNHPPIRHPTLNPPTRGKTMCLMCTLKRGSIWSGMTNDAFSTTIFPLFAPWLLEETLKLWYPEWTNWAGYGFSTYQTLPFDLQNRTEFIGSKRHTVAVHHGSGANNYWGLGVWVFHFQSHLIRKKNHSLKSGFATFPASTPTTLHHVLLHLQGNVYLTGYTVIYISNHR